jgi:hypothetical protein
MFPAERVDENKRSGEPPRPDQESGAIHLPWTGHFAHGLSPLKRILRSIWRWLDPGWVIVA